MFEISTYDRGCGTTACAGGLSLSRAPWQIVFSNCLEFVPHAAEFQRSPVQNKDLKNDTQTRTRTRTRTRTHTHSLSLSLSHTHTRTNTSTYTHTQVDLEWEAYNLQLFRWNFDGEQIIRFPVLFDCRSGSFTENEGPHQERCPPRQKSRVARLKTKVEPLLTEVDYELCLSTGVPRS